MSASTQSKLGAIDLPTALGRCEFQPDINMLIDRRAGIELAIMTLQEAGKLVEASKLFAHVLPKREAVWWACICAHFSEPSDIAEADRLAREIAADWVRKQDDDLRYAAYKQANETGFQSAHAWAAVAAFWSGASIAPRGTTPMAPGNIPFQKTNQHLHPHPWNELRPPARPSPRLHYPHPKRAG